VIHVYKKGEAFEVEFLTIHGETVAITTLEASQVCPVRKGKSLTLVYSVPRSYFCPAPRPGRKMDNNQGQAGFWLRHTVGDEE
jgi:hypothetical protein